LPQLSWSVREQLLWYRGGLCCQLTPTNNLNRNDSGRTFCGTQEGVGRMKHGEKSALSIGVNS